MHRITGLCERLDVLGEVFKNGRGAGGEASPQLALRGKTNETAQQLITAECEGRVGRL